MFGQLGWGTWIVNARWLPTLAPASTAFLTRTRHWARLWAKLAVEVNWPTACSSKTVHRQPQMLLGLDDACEEWQKIDEMGDGVSYNKRHISSRGQSRNQELNACRETGFFFFFFLVEGPTRACGLSGPGPTGVGPDSYGFPVGAFQVLKEERPTLEGCRVAGAWKVQRDKLAQARS